MRFAGYAAVFDKPDTGGDIVRRGAFVRTLGSKAPVGLLNMHDKAQPIGSIERLEEDRHGLRVIAKLDEGVGVSPGAGLSFGYRVRQSRKGTYRELLDLDLMEVSVVTHPMQPLARVLRVAE